MSRIRIEGPVRLAGEVTVRGAKNASLPIVIASGVAGAPITLENVPTHLKDIGVAIDALRHVGCDVSLSDGCVQMNRAEITQSALPVEIAGKFRYSLLFLGLLTGRCGHAKLSMPGGCSLGERKFDLHLAGLRKLGARVEETADGVEVWADKLIGADVEFYLPTTSGTENVMLAACFAQGRTRIFNANTRPEIADLGRFLTALGASVSVRNRVVEIEGPAKFGGATYSIMPGWDEALTYMMAAGMTGGEICVRNFALDHVQHDAAYLRQAGLDVFEWRGNVYVSGREKSLRAFDLFTAPYPGVNSDMQPLFATLASQCHGESTITDQRFTERFQYVKELRKLGMDIDSYGNCAVVRGPTKLRGASATALDLRCGAALVLAGLAADGVTEIDNCYQIDRGYEEIEKRLSGLGADVTRLESPD
ncbi:MAG TPA: UDP-N-acetylglucosamine 1-carboxyvinyltransferase [Phycisphaerae bacterium]|nr:UDP-N-acetylglucosamine 1-carboxyvinyltransferase [Phycisphaerae bacterium]